MTTLNPALTGALVALGGTITNAMNDDPEFVPCGRPAGIVMGNVQALGLNLSDEEYAARASQVLALADHVGDHHGAKVEPAYDASALSPVKEQLLDALIELSATTLPALERGINDRQVSAFFYRSLAAIAGEDKDAADQLDQLADIAKAAFAL